MLKKLFLLIFFVIASVSLYAQSNIDVTYQNINKIVVDGKITVNMHHSSSDDIKVKGVVTTAANEQLVIEGRKGELKIHRKVPVSFKKTELDSIVLDVFVKTPSNIQGKSDADIRILKEYELDLVTIEATTSAVISALISAESITLIANTNAKIVVVGKSPKVEVKVAGGASINTIQVECEYVVATASTNGECYVKASKLLELKATTFGNIFYKGVADEVVKNISTFGTIESF